MRVANCVPALTINQAALFFDPRGRPGPRRRLRRRRPFFAGFAVETLPSNDWIAERTSCCTRSRITVNKLFRLGIVSPFPAVGTRMPDHQQKQGGRRLLSQLQGELYWRRPACAIFEPGASCLVLGSLTHPFKHTYQGCLERVRTWLVTSER
jgi:hypothetical protein